MSNYDFIMEIKQQIWIIGSHKILNINVLIQVACIKDLKMSTEDTIHNLKGKEDKLQKIIIWKWDLEISKLALGFKK